MEEKYLAVIGIEEHNIQKYIVGAYSAVNHKSEDYQTFSDFGSAIKRVCEYGLNQPDLFEKVSTSFLTTSEEYAIEGIAKLVLEKKKINTNA